MVWSVRRRHMEDMTQLEKKYRALGFDEVAIFGHRTKDERRCKVDNILIRDKKLIVLFTQGDEQSIIKIENEKIDSSVEDSVSIMWADDRVKIAYGRFEVLVVITIYYRYKKYGVDSFDNAVIGGLCIKRDNGFIQGVEYTDFVLINFNDNKCYKIKKMNMSDFRNVNLYGSRLSIVDEKYLSLTSMYLEKRLELEYCGDNPEEFKIYNY
jgi:hypothetical protein